MPAHVRASASLRSSIRVIAGASKGGSPLNVSRVTSRHTTPSLLRPVRPLRCVACAFETHRIWGALRPEAASQCTSHARHESMTCVTFLIVTDDSAMADASTTRAAAPSLPSSASMQSSMSTDECITCTGTPGSMPSSSRCCCSRAAYVGRKTSTVQPRPSRAAVRCTRRTTSSAIRLVSSESPSRSLRISSASGRAASVVPASSALTSCR